MGENKIFILLKYIRRYWGIKFLSVNIFWCLWCIYNDYVIFFLKELFFLEEVYCYFIYINIWIYFWYWGDLEDDKEMIVVLEILIDFNLL